MKATLKIGMQEAYDFFAGKKVVEVKTESGVKHIRKTGPYTGNDAFLHAALILSSKDVKAGEVKSEKKINVEIKQSSDATSSEHVMIVDHDKFWNGAYRTHFNPFVHVEVLSEEEVEKIRKEMEEKMISEALTSLTDEFGDVADQKFIAALLKASGNNIEITRNALVSMREDSDVPEKKGGKK